MNRATPFNETKCKIEYGVAVPKEPKRRTYLGFFEEFIDSEHTTMALRFTDEEERDRVFNSLRYYRRKQLGLDNTQLLIMRRDDSIYVEKREG